jgi:hypothetical protein
MRPAASAGWIVLAGVTAAASSALWAQEWTTSGVDAQRSSWVRSDERLTKAAVADGTFAFLWKAQFDNRTRGPFTLTPPVLLDRLIGYRGFKALAFVGGSADRIFAIDTDLNKPYWQVQLNYSAATGGPPPITPECPGALTATPARRTALVQPAFAPGGGAHAGAGPVRTRCARSWTRHQRAVRRRRSALRRRYRRLPPHPSHERRH